MIGQKNLVEKINNLHPFPNVVLIIGDIGSGKHLVAKYITTNILNTDLVDITENITADFLVDLATKADKHTYLINLSDLTESNQNAILKFLEEPPYNSNIILIANSLSFILDTIYNRAIKLNMDLYSDEELINFIDNSSELFTEEDKQNILNICRTPGQLQKINYNTLPDIKRICNTIITSLSRASLPNTLSIADKINYNDEYDKFDINIFINMLIYTLNEAYKTNFDNKILKYIKLTIQTKEKISNNKLNKRHLMDNFLVNLWRISQCN